MEYIGLTVLLLVERRAWAKFLAAKMMKFTYYRLKHAASTTIQFKIATFAEVRNEKALKIKHAPKYATSTHMKMQPSGQKRIKLKERYSYKVSRQEHYFPEDAIRTGIIVHVQPTHSAFCPASPQPPK